MGEKPQSRRKLLKKGAKILGTAAIAGKASGSSAGDQNSNQANQNRIWGEPDVEIVRFLSWPTKVEEWENEIYLQVGLQNHEPDSVYVWGKITAADHNDNEYTLDPTPNDTLMNWTPFYLEEGYTQRWYRTPFPISMDTGVYGLELKLSEEHGGETWGTPIDRAYSSFSYGKDASAECVGEIREWDMYQTNEYVKPAGVASDIITGGVGGNCDFDD